MTQSRGADHSTVARRYRVRLNVVPLIARLERNNKMGDEYNTR